MKHVKNRSGFTLIEILVSMLIIPLIWLAIVVTLSVNTSLMSQTKHRSQAVFLLQQRLELLRFNGYAALPASAGIMNVTIDNRGTADPADDLIGTINTVLFPPVSISGGNFMAVNVIASWNENSVGGLVRVVTEGLVTSISDDAAGR